MHPRILVLGGNFGGLTAALTVKRELGSDVDLTVVSPSPDFLFTPSLIWMPFGRRTWDEITFPVEPMLGEHDIAFVEAAATSVDPVGRSVTLAGRRSVRYDYLVVATGSRHDDQAVPGLTSSGLMITDLAAAEETRRAWDRFRADPGDVVVAAAAGAGCFGAAYELLFEIAHQLKRSGLRKQVRLSYVTGEPFVGHLGTGGGPQGGELLEAFLRREGIDVRTARVIERVEPGALVLADGNALPFSFGVVVPPALGQQFLATADGLVDDQGFVKVRPTCQSEKYDDVYAVGAAAAVDAPWTTAVPLGVPKTGFPAEEMARMTAHNIAAQVRGEPVLGERALGGAPAACILPAGRDGAMVLADRTLPPHQHGMLLPGPQTHLMKVAFQKYYLWKMRHGLAHLP